MISLLFVLLLSIVFLLTNCPSLYVILKSGYYKKPVDEFYNTFIYLFPSFWLVIFVPWGIWSAVGSFKNPADPNIGLGIVLVYGVPFCTISFALSVLAHYCLVD